MTWEKRRLLVWGTTYPEFSKKYYETVCTGAIDEASGKLLRIYPITLRYLDHQFSLYNWIDAEIERNPADVRPESYRIRQDTIEVVGNVDTKDGWAERARWVLGPGNVFASLRALRAAQQGDRTSLGLIKPSQIRRVHSKRKSDDERREWEERRTSALAQREMFVDPDTNTKDLHFVPVRYYVDFICDAPSGPSEHSCSVLDWGTYVLHRKMFAQHGGGIAERKVIEKIQSDCDPTKKDIYFFMGNTLSHVDNFSIVGFFYPPKRPTTGARKAVQGVLPGL